MPERTPQTRRRRSGILLAAAFAIGLPLPAPLAAGARETVVDQSQVGLVIHGSIGQEPARALKIAAVRDDPDSDGLLYVITDPDGQNPLCGMAADGKPVEALPLAGTWNPRMDWSPEGLTFACTNGVLAKCIRWGYAPWARRPGVDMRALYQTCLRMARADYCGDGVPHTEEGTPINLWDIAGIQNPDKIDGMTFEAAWGPNGAVAIARTRWPQDLAYVQTHCPDRLQVNDARSEGALLYNDSFPR